MLFPFPGECVLQDLARDASLSDLFVKAAAALQQFLQLYELDAKDLFIPDTSAGLGTPILILVPFAGLSKEMKVLDVEARFHSGAILLHQLSPEGKATRALVHDL